MTANVLAVSEIEVSAQNGGSYGKFVSGSRVEPPPSISPMASRRLYSTVVVDVVAVAVPTLWRSDAVWPALGFPYDDAANDDDDGDTNGLLDDGAVRRGREGAEKAATPTAGKEDGVDDRMMTSIVEAAIIAMERARRGGGDLLVLCIEAIVLGIIVIVAVAMKLLC